MLRVQEICKNQGLTMQDLAKKMGVTYQALYAAVSGNPTVGKLQEIANVLGVEVSELFAAPKEGAITCPHCGNRITIKAGKPE